MRHESNGAGAGGEARETSFRAATGLTDFDACVFTRSIPDASHVVPTERGVGFMAHVAGAGSMERDNLVAIPALDNHVLVLWTKGAPGLWGEIEGKRIARHMSAGAALLVRAGRSSRWIADASTVDGVIHVHIPAVTFRQTCIAEGLTPPEEPEVPAGTVDPWLRSILACMADEAGAAGRPSPLAWSSYATLLQLRLARAPWLVPLVPQAALAPWQVKRTTEFLQDNAARDVDLASLAALVNLSPFYFARAFKRATGCSPYRYQMLARLERAKRLLVQTELSISDVAAAVGYELPQALARLFRRELGTSPNRFRRAYKT